MSSIKEPASPEWEQLMMMREMTRRTGIMHESQMLQLKIWPRVLFQDSSKAEVSIDMVERSMYFRIAVDGSKSTAANGRKSAAERLDSFVKAMMGDEWHVEVAVKGKKRQQQYVFGPREE